MVLSGWKEIAQYARAGVRTVQRWQGIGFPVRRPSTVGGPVFAFSEDIDEWIKRTESSRNGDGAGLSTNAAFHHQVLVVDHDKTLLAITSALLVDAGFTVETAQDGFEALSVFRSGASPDVVVCDLNMPKMSGFELLGVLRKRFPSVAVIATSADFAPAGSPEPLCDVFLPKDSDLERSLVPGVRDVIARSPLRAQPAKPDQAPAWVPRSRAGYVVLTCTDCLRSFAAPARELAIAAKGTEACVHCGVNVTYRIDSTVAATLFFSEEESEDSTSESKAA